MFGFKPLLSDYFRINLGGLKKLQNPLVYIPSNLSEFRIRASQNSKDLLLY
jgi:hypothetical protein